MSESRILVIDSEVAFDTLTAAAPVMATVPAPSVALGV